MLSKVQIKTIHSLQHKKYRQKSGYFLAEGVKVVHELLTAQSITIEKIYALPSWITKNASLLQSRKSISVLPVSESELKTLSCLTHPQETLALCKIPHQESFPVLEGQITLLLEAIRDPGNLGTIIRIADWFGLSQILCSSDCVDAYNPKVIQATMGSISRIKIWSGPVSDFIQKNKHIPLIATTLKGDSLNDFSKIEEGIIAIGNESAGLSDCILQRAHQCLTIPRLGGAESLNAAVATGIVCNKLILG